MRHSGDNRIQIAGREAAAVDKEAPDAVCFILDPADQRAHAPVLVGGERASLAIVALDGFQHGVIELTARLRDQGRDECGIRARPITAGIAVHQDLLPIRKGRETGFEELTCRGAHRVILPCFEEFQIFQNDPVLKGAAGIISLT